MSASGSRWWAGWPGLAAVLIVYVGFAAWGYRTDRFLNDEGLLTHLMASGCARDFAPTFFLQKSRPPICALYAPAAAMGLRGFLFAHIAVGGVAVVALWGAAVRLRHNHPTLVAGALAVSPLMLGGSVAGVSNTDAVAAVCIFAWLRASERRVWAAAVVGAAVFIRSELAVLALLVALDALRSRRWKELAGLGSFAALYGLAGAGYHADLLWMVHFPPALPDAMPGNPFWSVHSGEASLSDIVTTAVALSPLLPLVALVHWRSLSEDERLGVVFAGLFALALIVLPRWRVFNFDQSPRYLLPLLPWVLLAVGRVVDRLATPSEHPTRGVDELIVAGLAGVAVAGALGAEHPTGLLAVGIVAAGLALSRAGLRLGFLTLACASAFAGPLAFADGGRIDRRSMAPHLEELVARLDEAQTGGIRPIYTNEPLLSVYAHRNGRPYAPSIHYIVQADQRFELESLANPGNGQREALWKALEPDFYGIPIRGLPLRPDGVPDNVVFALVKDERLDLAMPPELWDGLLRIIAPGYGSYVAEFEEGVR